MRVEGYEASTYGERFAAAYDDWTVTVGIAATTAAAVAAIVELLDDLGRPAGPVLELGIGTGRVALPLSDRGVAVHGIDASPSMVERLRAKPGGDAIPVTIGDFADVAVEGRYPLVFAAFNTFFALLDQEAQVRCFLNVAAHLEPGGCFAVETFVPDVARFDGGQTVRARTIELDRVQLDVAHHDPVHQRIDSQLMVIGSDHPTRLFPVRLRYAWPSELDLMARIAGLSLRHRSAGWGGGPFSAASRTQVAVYQRSHG